MKKFLSLLLALVMLFSLVACGDNSDNDGKTPVNSGDNQGDVDVPGDNESEVITFDPNETYTWRDYQTALATTWNPHTYQDTTADAALGPLTSPLYALIYNDALHPHEGKEDFTAYSIVPEMAAKDPEDVTAEVKAAHPDWIPEGAESGYAWRIEIREGLSFDNGHVINANTFVESVKRLLDPEALNYRATDFYNGAYGVVGAEPYALGLAGKKITQDNGDIGVQLDDCTVGDDGIYVTADGNPLYIAVDRALSWMSGETLKNYVEMAGEAYFGLETWPDLLALVDDEGLVPCTDANLALLAGVTTTNPARGETEADLFNYLYIVTGQYPDELKFEDTVGFYAEDDTHLVVVYKSPLAGFTLYYNGALFGSFSLVDPEVYDACLSTTETASGTVITSTYMTSPETSPSYGPYILTEYQAEKMMHYTKNDKWFGWGQDFNRYKDPTDGKIYEKYQTTDYEIEVVGEDDTQKLMFFSGDFMTYGLKAEDYAQYRNSDYAYTSPSATIYFLILNGNLEQIQAREASADFDKATEDLETMTVPAFRSAMAVSFDRDDFAASVMPNCTPGYGIYGDTAIYDVENCSYYRESDQAKQVLLDYYSVDASQFSSVDEAVDSITGYDPEAAKKLLAEAYDEAIEKGYITDNDGDGISDQTVTIYMSRDSESDRMNAILEYMNKSVNEISKGTPFDGKIKFDKSPILEDWVEPLRNGEYDFNLAGWQGSELDPFSLMDAYVNPTYAYDYKWFDATKHNMTLTIDGEEITMSLRQWSDCLNGTDTVIGGKTYNFGSNNADVETRLNILAGLEGQFLSTGDYLPIFNAGSMFLLSQKVYFVTEDYNPILGGRGGMTYAKYNYSDSEWDAFVKEQIASHGQLQY